ncbi:ABC transporter permease [Streptococcus gallolyticus]|nr:ABC transporter permease [Streptococcus gallolyticus]MBY5041699.1 ABC transporter permease [Streptococcus gallolyticus]
MPYSWKELLFYKKKYLLIELLIILMMFMVVFLSGLANGLGRAVSAAIENSPASYYILSDKAEKVITFSNMTEEDLAAVDDLQLKDKTGLSIQRTGLVPQNGDEDTLDIMYFVIDPASFIAPKAVEGKSLTTEKNTILLNDSLKAKGVKLGDVLEDEATGTQLTVSGFTHNEMYAHGPVAYISEQTYKDLQKERNPNFSYHPQAFAVKDKAVADQKLADLEIIEKNTLISKIPGYSAEQSTLNMILWVLVLASAAILGVFFYIITLQKRHEFSVMKAIGMSMFEIGRFQLAQILFLALLGILVGDGLAYALSLALPVSMPFVLNFVHIAWVSLAFLVIALLSSGLSILKVAKIDPVEVINGGEE